MRTFLSIFISLFITVCQAQSQFTSFSSISSPKHEVRAVWLTTIGGIDWPHRYAQSQNTIGIQQKELTDILDKLQEAGINTILLQTRIRGTVIYPSKYEPWDGCLSGTPGKSPGYDALAFAIAECHKRGMELHAWIVTMPVGKWNAHGCKRLRQSQPNIIRKIAEEGYMNPELASTGDYLANLCAEITNNYDVDGIHLDYIRYPETWKINVSPTKGRQYITDIVRKIHDKVKVLKPWVKMSCSPIGKADDLSRYWSHGWNAYSRVCQDAQGWLQQGLMDELFPMMYFKDNNFYPFAIDWKEQSAGKIVVPGLGIYFMSPSEKNWDLETITREMAYTRNLQQGHAFFRSKFFTDNTKDIYDFTTKTFNTFPALIPPMTWASSIKPECPKKSFNKKYGYYFVTTDSASDQLYYNIYASRNWPVDTDISKHLIKVRTQKAILPDDGHFYAITTTDRYGNESAPLQLSQTPNRHISHMGKMLKHNNRQVFLPDFINQLDADTILIINMAGQIVATTPLYGKTLDISLLPTGWYQAYAQNKKGINHRLGYLDIKK